MGTCAGPQRPWRGGAFKRRFVGQAEAHFHAKRLTSEHLLLLNAFLSPEGRESCGVGRAHSEERGPELTSPGRQSSLSPGWRCTDSPVEASRVPPGAGPRRRTQRPCGGARVSFVPRAPRRSQWCGLRSSYPVAAPERVRKSFWSCQSRSPRIEVPSPGSGARTQRSLGHATRGRGPVTPRAGTLRPGGGRAVAGRGQRGDPDAGGRGHGGGRGSC